MRLKFNGWKNKNIGFRWNLLSSESPTEYNNHSGTTTINRKSFTNLNTGVVQGKAIRIHGTGSGTIIIENSYFGPTIAEAITIENFTGTIIIRNCLFVSNKTGIYATTCSGDIQVEYCQFVNPWGCRDCRGQAVQFNTCTGENSHVQYCRGESWRGEGYTEDWVSMYRSGGTISQQWVNSENRFRGGGPSQSGGGMLAGDGGAPAGDYVTLENNWFINPGNYGFAVVGGTGNIMNGNRVFQECLPWSNVGVIIWGQGGASCSNVTYTNNHINAKDDTCGANNYFNGGNCGTITDSGNVYNESLATMLPDFPEILINYVTEDILWQVRKESVQFRDEGIGGSCDGGGTPAALHRPTAVSESDKSIVVSSTTINSTGSVSTEGFNYNWVQVSGPNTATLTNETTATLSVSSMITGLYRFRLELTDDDGASDADWTEVTVNL